MGKLGALAVALVFGGLSAALADSWTNAGARVFAEKNGHRGIKVIPIPTAANSHAGEVEARGVVFRLDDDGKEVVLWDRKLVNIPVDVLLSSRSDCVVTLDTWGRAGYEHALVIYGAKGAILADFKLADLLSDKEIKDNVEQSTSSRHWRSGSDIRIDEGAGQLVITLKWGKRIAVDLKSGKVA